MVSTLPSREAICCLFNNEGRRGLGFDVPGEESGQPSFSVVICTDNRLEHLKRALSALRYQTYSNFEVCVVAGPTDDGTHAFLAALDEVRVESCRARNLSQSRNIGIAMAAGDIVAFIDDDAVPEPEWLVQLSLSYDDDRVGAAGGVVHDHIGIDYQAQFVTVNRLGQPRQELRPTPELNFPGSEQFPHLLGTNCSFRRAALISIGGFDEVYEYFLDETDVCCRINDAGYRIVQRPDAFVHHKYAPSALRDEQRIVRSWYPIIKNRLYFGLRHARASVGLTEAVAAGLAEKDCWERDVTEKGRAGALSHEDIERFQREAEAAIEDGLLLAMEEPKLLTEDLLGRLRAEFRRFPRRVPTCGSRVILYMDVASDGNVRDQNPGLPNELLSHARAAVDQGHQVHFVFRGAATPSVDYDDGLWLHDLGTQGLPNSRADDRSMISTTVKRIASRRWIDRVYCRTADRASLKKSMDFFATDDLQRSYETARISNAK